MTTVVCFAFADMAAVRSMQPEIPGDHVHLVPGIERETEGLVMHLLHDVPMVLVVVHSPALPTEQLEEVLVTFGKQRDRNHRLCVVEFDASRRQAFLDEIRVAVKDMRARIASPGIQRSPSASMRARIPATTPAAAPPQARPALQVPSAEPRLESVESAAEISTDALATTNPGASESGTTFPDLGESLKQVRRGRAQRTRRRRKRLLVGAFALVSAGAATGWVIAGRGVTEAAAPPVSQASVSPRRPGPPVRLPPPVRPTASEEAPATSPSAASVEGSVSEARRVAAALDAGQVRALDALLVRVGPRAAVSFPDARRRCTRLEVAGLSGWRLPSLDELRRLRRARLLPDGEFWSTARGPENSRYTLSRDVTRPQEHAREDGDVRALCIRQR